MDESSDGLRDRRLNHMTPKREADDLRPRITSTGSSDSGNAVGQRQDADTW